MTSRVGVTLVLEAVSKTTETGGSLVVVLGSTLACLPFSTGPHLMGRAPNSHGKLNAECTGVVCPVNEPGSHRRLFRSPEGGTPARCPGGPIRQGRERVGSTAPISQRRRERPDARRGAKEAGPRLHTCREPEGRARP